MAEMFTMIHFIQNIKDQQGVKLMVIWLCLLSATLLIVPISLTHSTDSSNWLASYMPYTLILAILTGSYLIATMLLWAISFYSTQYKARKLIESRNKMIRQLDFEEKAVLREFIIQAKNVLPLPMKQPAVMNLLRSGVLEPAFETQEIKGNSRIIKLSIAIEARELLTNKVLGFPVGKMTDEVAARLKAARPDYARSNYIALIN